MCFCFGFQADYKNENEPITSLFQDSAKEAGLSSQIRATLVTFVNHTPNEIFEKRLMLRWRNGHEHIKFD